MNRVIEELVNRYIELRRRVDILEKIERGVFGSGTANTIPKFTGANAIGDSVISETSDGVQIQTGKTVILNGYGLDTNGYLAKFPEMSIKDHFVTNTLSSYWTGWTTSPGQIIQYNFFNHFLRAMTTNLQQDVTCFLYRNENVSANQNLGAWCGPDCNGIDVGIRIDNGYIDNNNEYSVEILIRSGIETYSNYSAALFTRVRSGATIIESQCSPVFEGLKVFVLKMIVSSASTIYAFIDNDIWGSTGVATISYNFSPVRHGLFIRSRISSWRVGQFHYYMANF